MSADNSSPDPKRIIAWVIAPVAVFLVLLFTLEQVNGEKGRGDSPTSTAVTEGGTGVGSRGDLATQVESLESATAQDPSNPAGYALLGDALYQQFRETGDGSLIERSQSAFDSALVLDSRDVSATIGQGTLALVRHDFEGGLQYGQQARRLAPDLVRPYSLIADGQIELGRYDAAARTLERFVGLKPSLPSYTRVSYFRELNGDVDGAVQAMRLAVSSAGGGEPLAFTQTLLANLEFDRGRIAEAEALYRQAAASDRKGYVPALAGLARVDAARGDLDSAIARYREVVARLPLPEYGIALAEAELAAGRRAAAKRDLELVEAEAKVLLEADVSVDSELVLFEADHGDPEEAVALGAMAWRQAPSVTSADSYSWALYSAGRTEAATRMSERAMQLGSRDPSFVYHAGRIALAAGDRSRAQRLLGRLVRESPRFDPLSGPRARQALAELR